MSTTLMSRVDSLTSDDAIARIAYLYVKDRDWVECERELFGLTDQEIAEVAVREAVDDENRAFRNAMELVRDWKFDRVNGFYYASPDLWDVDDEPEYTAEHTEELVNAMKDAIEEMQRDAERQRLSCL